MNRNEVMALSDGELTIKAGLLSEWHFHVIGHDGRPSSRGWSKKEKIDGEDDLLPLPDFLNDIAAAWPLAEQAGLSVLRVGEEWWVGVFDGSNGDWWFVRDPMCDTNAARAITRAFVLAMTQEAT